MLALPMNDRRFGSSYLRRPALRRATLALAAVTAAGVALRYGADPAGAVAAGAAFVLVVLAAIDLEQRRVPNAIVVPAAALVLAGRIATDPQRAWVRSMAYLGLSVVAVVVVAALIWTRGRRRMCR